MLTGDSNRSHHFQISPMGVDTKIPVLFPPLEALLELSFCDADNTTPGIPLESPSFLKSLSEFSFYGTEESSPMVLNLSCGRFIPSLVQMIFS